MGRSFRLSPTDIPPAPAPYRLRAARLDEAARLSAIEAAAAARFREQGLAWIAEGPPVAPQAYAILIEAGRVCVAADADDMPVGFAAWYPLDGCLYLAEMDVLPQHAGHRLGAALIGELVRIAQAAHMPALLLTTFRNVPWNAPYYARLGFRILDANGITSELAAEIQRQTAAGLPPQSRVAMRLDLNESLA